MANHERRHHQACCDAKTAAARAWRSSPVTQELEAHSDGRSRHVGRVELQGLGSVLAAAESWRDVMVSSNRPCGGYPADDPDGRAHWRGVNNHNGRLVQTVDNLRARREAEEQVDVVYATAVMHFELTHGRTACGRKLPTRGFTTDDMGILESGEGTRCKSCWRVVQADRVATERLRDMVEARARRERGEE